MPRMKGGDLIAEFLLREGIDHVFALCGHGNVGMLDALFGVRDRITVVSPRHEQTAGHMADAYFRVKHRPAATLTSCGPGSANMVMALANAYADSSAFLALTANVPTQQFNRAPVPGTVPAERGGFPVGLPPRREARVPADAGGNAAGCAAARYETMLGGRPGPVQVDVPFNLFQEEARRRGAAEHPAAHRAPLGCGARGRRRRRRAAARRRASGAVHRPRRHAVGGRGQELTALAERLTIPVISSPNGMGCIPMAHRPVARLHRPQRRVPGQPGRPPRRPRACDRRALRRSLGFLLDRGIFVEFSRREIDPGGHRRRTRSAATTRSISASWPMRRVSCARLLAACDRRAGWPCPARAGWLGAIAGWREEWRTSPAEFCLDTSPLRPEPVVAAVRKRVAGRCDHVAGFRRAPQLVHAVLGGAASRKPC